ncbi:MAG: hypothetical protein ACLPPF_16265 [Rhodomicrobium sp.]
MRAQAIISVLAISLPLVNDALAMGSSPLAHAPEIDATGSIVALAAIAAFAVIIWERRRRRS